MKILTIETTCDETAAAVVDHELQVLSSVVASQEELHERFQGVVPEIAARAHLERMLPVIDETLRRADCTLAELEAIAVASTPGLAGSLVVGLMAAKTLAMVLEKPLITINHLHAHVYACRIAAGHEIFPCVGLIVSGGHSHLYRCEDALTFQYLGGTIDDAAGEAFDKVATMLGLGYPGGPLVSKLAVEGDVTAYRFARPFLNEPERLDFSFSGLKTAVRYAISNPACGPFDNSKLTDQEKRNLAASFEAAVVDCLVEKSICAIEHTGLTRLCVGGGVAANRRFRDQLTNECETRGVELTIAPIALCTDNAVMGAIAFEKLSRGMIDSLDVDVQPGLVRG